MEGGGEGRGEKEEGWTHQGGMGRVTGRERIVTADRQTDRLTD